jgi:hypothetical protein
MTIPSGLPEKGSLGGRHSNGTYLAKEHCHEIREVFTAAPAGRGEFENRLQAVEGPAQEMLPHCATSTF